MFQEDVHTNRVAIRQYEKIAVTGYRVYRAVSVTVLTNMVAWNSRSDAFSAPTMLGLVDPSKAGLILKHQPNSLGIVEDFFHFLDSRVNFFLRRQLPHVSHSSDVCFWAAFSTIHVGATQSISDHVLFRVRPSHRKLPLWLSHRLYDRHLLH